MSGAFNKRVALGQCVLCAVPHAEMNPKTGKRHVRCLDCRAKLQRISRQQRLERIRQRYKDRAASGKCTQCAADQYDRNPQTAELYTRCADCRETCRKEQETRRNSAPVVVVMPKPKPAPAITHKP